MEIKEALLKAQWQQMMEGENVIKEQVLLRDADHFQEKNPDLDPETVLMEIHTNPSSEKRGHLDWQTIIVHPHKVGDEYNMSHGFFHKRNDSEDYYWCAQGEGLLMMMDRNGGCWCEELEEGSLHHIEDDLAVRLINISDVPLIVSHCYPSEAGLDYETVKNNPFPCHIYEDDGEMCIRVDIKENEEQPQEDFTFEEVVNSGQ